MQGNVWHIVTGAVFGAASGALLKISSNAVSGKPLLNGVGLAMGTGAISGGIAASGLGVGIQVAVAATTAAIDGWGDFKDDVAAGNIGSAVVSYATNIGVSSAFALIGGANPGFSPKHAANLGNQAFNRISSAVRYNDIDDGIKAIKWFAKSSKGITRIIAQNTKESFKDGVIGIGIDRALNSFWG